MPRPTFIHHLHPPTIPQEQARFNFTLGAGGLAVFFSIILGITGLLEMFYYIPTPEKAALSVQIISFHVPLGGFIRNLHFWAGQALLTVTGIHFLRVVLTGAYSSPRRVNYLIGMGLFILAILLDFSGYILRWDIDIQWALVTGTNLLRSIPLIGENLYYFVVGSPQIGAATVLRFYTWHCFGLVIAAGVLVVWHIFRVRRDGGITSPPTKPGPKQNRVTRFELVNREILAMLYAGAILVVLAALADAPIAPPITETHALTEQVRAPWFFLWIQELLHFGSPFWFGVFIPLVILGCVAGIPYTFKKTAPQELGKWFPSSGRPAQITALLVFLIILLLTIRAL